MSNGVAKRYATALIEVAREIKQVDEIGKELQELISLFKQHSSLSQILESPAVPSSQKKQIYSEIKDKFSQSGFFKNWIRFGKDASRNDDGPVDNLIKLLIDRNRLSILPLLEKIYQDLADEAKQRLRIEVSSAVELGEQAVLLKNLLEKRFGGDVVLKTKIDPTILGGMVIQSKDIIFDASLKGDLARMKEAILEQI